MPCSRDRRRCAFAISWLSSNAMARTKMACISSNCCVGDYFIAANYNPERYVVVIRRTGRLSGWRGRGRALHFLAMVRRYRRLPGRGLKPYPRPYPERGLITHKPGVAMGYVSLDGSAQERAEPAFGELSFRCPVNERTVSTGIYTDEASLTRLQLIDIRVRCPHCGDVHTIRVADTFVSQTIIGRYRPSLLLVSSR